VVLGRPKQRLPSGRRAHLPGPAGPDVTSGPAGFGWATRSGRCAYGHGQLERERERLLERLRERLLLPRPLEPLAGAMAARSFERAMEIPFIRAGRDVPRLASPKV
jgi:hypothetical protein